MNKLFYEKLAYNNIKKNKQTYIPYVLTCIGTILMFYNIAALTYHSAMNNTNLSSLMDLGLVITGIFSVIFLFYSHSFLIKRRKKEFGVFHILGMEKRHIAIIMFWENTMIAGISILAGLATGILFNKLFILILYKIIKLNPQYGFQLSAKAILITVALFAAIFFLTLLNSILQVYRAKTIELLHGGNVGEREPKSNWFLALVGIATLAYGYYLSLSIKNPLSALKIFFFAVILVIIGTYCLFTSGSIILLKLLKKNKAYYYKTNHFVSVSGMIYRMKKNAVGLANICIMSTIVIIMVSTTVCLYVGLEDVMSTRYPSDASVTTEYTPETRFDTTALIDDIKAKLDGDNIAYENLFGFQYLSFTVTRDENRYTDVVSSLGLDTDHYSDLIFMTADDYQKLTGEQVSLNPDEVITYSKRNEDSIQIFDQTYTVKANHTERIPIGEFAFYTLDTVLVVGDSNTFLDSMYAAGEQRYGSMANDMSNEICYEVDFDFNNLSNQDLISYCKNNFIPNFVNNNPSGYDLSAEIKQLNIDDFYELYGGLFFLGIFLGGLFLLATVLIIYYKQVVEGYEDKERFRIMQNVGMSLGEVKKSIHSQVLTVFALPILCAIVHVAVAFPIMTQLLVLFNLTNTALFVICTIMTSIAFVIIYVIVYFLTSKVYYGIVAKH